MLTHKSSTAEAASIPEPEEKVSSGAKRAFSPMPLCKTNPMPQVHLWRVNMGKMASTSLLATNYDREMSQTQRNHPQNKPNLDDPDRSRDPVHSQLRVVPSEHNL
jgi:hypothetical protein